MTLSEKIAKRVDELVYRCTCGSWRHVELKRCSFCGRGQD